MALKDEKGICEHPPENVIPQHPDCDPANEECAHDNRISIELVPGQCTTRGEDPHFKKGYELYHEGRDDDAIVELDASLGVNPDNAEAHLLIGDIYERKRMFDEAIREYKEALRISPDDKMTQVKMQNAIAQSARR